MPWKESSAMQERLLDDLLPMCRGWTRDRLAVVAVASEAVSAGKSHENRKVVGKLRA
jgi:hypothetical protein